MSAQRRMLFQALALALGLVALLWAADAGARLGARTLLARNIQAATGVPEPPVVGLRGAFFLPQVIRGAYSEADVVTRGLVSGPLRVKQLDSRLVDVRLPFHDVLVRDLRRVGIGQSSEVATLTYDDLDAYFNATGRPLKLSGDDDGTVRVYGLVNVLGQPIRASATVAVSVDNDALVLTPQQIDTGSAGVSTATRLLLAQRLRLTVPLGTLPFGHELRSVRTFADRVEVVVVGSRIIVQP